jgi:hypothetical protein
VKSEEKFWIFDFGFWIEEAEQMKKTFGSRSFELSLRFNLKSKIQNPKWLAFARRFRDRDVWGCGSGAAAGEGRADRLSRQ